MNSKFSNALINETSPYLLQHAHNPVNWFPWGDEALALSREQDKPILVSIGYSACHWCHVMERESFEDESIAQYMNEHFINIKIDREERPDLDHIYMDALQAIAGNGGWPLNIFLTSEAKPFYGGTYFPPEKAFNRVSWSDVLHSMNEVWNNKREEVEEQANRLIAHIQKSNSFADANTLMPLTETVSFYNADDCRLMAAQFLKNADRVDGGYGQAPKFLHTYSLKYQLQFGHFYNKEEGKQHALLSLEKMLQGGIYDQLAGGISRYSTDNQWLAPHFEKMLYDNALMVDVLCDAYQLSGKKIFKKGISNILQFLEHTMKHTGGGYFTALDADSEGIEGKFYVWQKVEIEELLGDDAALLCDYFNVTEKGNWEEGNILNVQTDNLSFAEANNMDLQQWEEKLNNAKALLLARRNERIHPGTDDKILLNGNALLITALCKAYAALGDDAFKSSAVELFNFIYTNFRALTTGLHHTFKNGSAKFPAFLDDYAYLVQACIHLQEITSDQSYLERAKELTLHLLDNFADEASPFFFYTHHGQQDIVVRKVEIYDGATPSANGIMAHNLLYLGTVLEEKAWTERGHNMIRLVFNGMKKYPSSFAVWAGAYLVQTVGVNEVVLTGKRISDELRAVLNEYLPNKILQSSIREADYPLLHNKAFEDTATIYLCKNYNCLQPTKNVNELVKSLQNFSDINTDSQ